MLKKIISISLTMAVMGWPMGGQIGWAKGKAEDPVAAAEVIKANVAKLGLGMKSEVTVKLRNKAQIKGHVTEAGDNSVSIVDSKSGELKTVAYSEVKELKQGVVKRRKDRNLERPWIRRLARSQCHSLVALWRLVDGSGRPS